MVHGAVRHMFRAVGVIALAIVIAVPLLIWRLSMGPISLDFLTPSIRSAAVAKDGSWHVDLDNTVLALGHGRHMVEVQALGVRFFLGNDANPALAVPVMALSFNGRSLMAGLLAPSAVRIEEPHVHLIRDENNHMSLGINDNKDVGPTLPLTLLDEFTGEYDPMKPGRQLKEFSVSGAEVTFEDHVTHQTLDIPWADVTIKRTATGGAFSLAATFDQDLGAGTVRLNADFNRETAQWTMQVATAAMRLAPFSRFDPSLASLSILDFPISGTVNFSGDLTAGLQHVGFDLTGDQGHVRLLVPAGFQYDLASMALKGATENGLKQLKITDFKLALTDGPRLAASLGLDNLTGGPVGITVDAAYDHLGFDALKHLWPEILAPNPREWILANLSKGMIKDGTLSLAATWKPQVPDDLDVQKLTGKFKATGLSVNYITPMPVVHDGWGDAVFDQKSFRVNIAGGQVEGLKVTSGLAEFTGLDQAEQFANIEVTTAGPLTNVLKLIDKKPLGYASIMGIDPGAVGGEAKTTLNLHFPLLKDLRLDSMSIKVHSDLDEVKLPKVFAGLDLTQGKLALDLDAKGMDVSGPIQLSGIPASLQWRENFVAKSPFRSRYLLRAPVIEAKQFPVLGLDTPPFVSPWMDGTVGATVAVTSSGKGKADIDVVADLTAAKMSLPGLDWHKEQKTTGGAKVRILVENNRLAAIPSFDVVAGDLKTAGSVAFNADGHARRVEFKHLSYGRTAAEGTLDVGAGGALSLNLSGTSFDATPIVSPDNDGMTKKNDAKDMQPLRIAAQFKRVWLSRPGSITDVSATMSREQGDWRTVVVKAKVGTDAKDFLFNITGLGPQQRRLQLVSGDAGAVLHAFDVYDDLVGGAMGVDGLFADDKPNQPLDGNIHISDYKVVNTPALARLLTVASLTGVQDVLKGDGISFSSLDAPFSLADGVLKVKDARTAGTSLGITANGEIDIERNRLKLDGTLVPFYTINSALGGVPVLGWLLNGGETGGGLVAFNFAMKGPADEPEVSINPLSALTPGFLRHLFDVFDGGQTGVRKTQ